MNLCCLEAGNYEMAIRGKAITERLEAAERSLMVPAEQKIDSFYIFTDNHLVTNGLLEDFKVCIL